MPPDRHISLAFPQLNERVLGIIRVGLLALHRRFCTIMMRMYVVSSSGDKLMTVRVSGGDGVHHRYYLHLWSPLHQQGEWEWD